MDVLGTTFVEAAHGVFVSLDKQGILLMPYGSWLELKLVLEELNPAKGN